MHRLLLFFSLHLVSYTAALCCAFPLAVSTVTPPARLSVPMRHATTPTGQRLF
ncbi:uncharacterized protein BDR25DRAFT_308166 [Lindgomyces ingoldianus]|uniref:Uncharacterized protein n=1 Tax=Lindgomyces ingoldianus TaxID=673940 RepID=A0ACB6Q9C5_9PLEO|nr:uncharacterized protein BDR25DRAFT_308166 [Lindgomyces ingoldianus]KAF2462712.1 hypothetical protein BDR25DRAFT_308166 [Lindgomyces ingoldianus]